jgi:hypothetical protein
MTAHALSESEVLVRIAPGSARWPKAASTLAWVKLHDAVNNFRATAIAIDAACAVAEDDRTLTPTGTCQRRTAIAKAALADLESNKLFQSALKYVDGDVANFESKIAALLPQEPTDIAGVSLAKELRTIVRGSKSPIDSAIRALTDNRVLGAILHAPPMASGLTEAEYGIVRQRARAAAAPTQAAAAEALTKARAELVETKAAMRRLILERTDLTEDALEQPMRKLTPVPAAVGG